MLKSLLTLTLLAAFAPLAGAQAYCALRDPNKQIYKLFEEATSYRSIVRTIDEGSREGIAKRLPFTLHFNELGRHTLYVAMKDGESLGVVHVRSEAGKWGLVEVAWAFDMNLRVVDFGFQRCRDRSKSFFEQPDVRSKFIGAGFNDLRGMIDRPGTSLDPEALPLPSAAESLGMALVRNGLKTIAATESAWGADLRLLRAERIVRWLNPSTIATPSPDSLYDEFVTDELEREVGLQSTGIDRSQAYAFDLTGAAGHSQGQLFSARWKRDGLDLTLWWSIDKHGAITAIDSQGPWPQQDLRSLFQAQVGKTRQDFEGCASAVDLATMEVLITLQSQVHPSAK